MGSLDIEQDAAQNSQTGVRNIAELISDIIGDATGVGDLALDQIIDRNTIQALMEKVTRLTGLATAILDLKGNILVATGWQDICTKFHRCNCRTAAYCRESDLFLAQNVKPGEYIAYKCKNNMWDVVTPLYIAGHYVGNIFAGQFFYDDEVVDENIYITHAEKYGFEKDEYLAALRRVPRVSRDKITALMDYLVALTDFISRLSYANLQLAKSVTNYREAEIKLHQQNEFLQQLIDTIPSPVYFKDTTGRFQGCNREYERISGLKREHIIGRTASDFCDARDSELFTQKDDELFKNPGIQVFETKLRSRGFNGRDVIFYKATYTDTAGAVAGLIGVIIDITEHRKAEETIKMERQQLLSIFSSIEQIIYVIDPKSYEVLYVNEEAQRVLQKNPIGGLCYKELYGFDAPCSFCTNDIILANRGKPYKWEYHNPLVDRDYSITDRIISWPDGREVRFELAVDITDRKRAEAEQIKLRDELFQAQKMESIGRLAGGVAHDFNNMLQVILGYAGFSLRKTDPDSAVYRSLQQIHVAAERSSDLTRQLLAFARKQSVMPQVLNLNESVERMLQMLRRLIGENIELIWRAGTELWSVKIDPAQVDQILANLCTNARDAIGSVGVLTIETSNITVDEQYRSGREEFTPGEYVMLTISDTGCGIDKENQEHLFEPFFTTKGVGQGTGLGLATVFGAVKQNDGFIYVYSEPGMGSTFKIYLPRCCDTATVQVNMEAEACGGTETILLVEDEMAILELGKAILQQYGYNIIAARNPAAALVVAEEYDGPIHLLLSDVVMPGMNGKQLRDKLAVDRPGIKTLYMSGYTANVIAHHGVIDEGVNFLQKPFSELTLVTMVRKILDQALAGK